MKALWIPLALVFSEIPTAIGWFGILVCAAGVILMQLARVSERRSVLHVDAGSAHAVLAGLLLVLASFSLKEANSVLVELNPRVGASRFEVAAHTLFNVTWMEVVLLTGWLWWRLPGELARVPIHWRRMVFMGLTGFLGKPGLVLGLFADTRRLRQGRWTNRSDRGGVVLTRYLERARGVETAPGYGRRHRARPHQVRWAKAGKA